MSEPRAAAVHVPAVTAPQPHWTGAVGTAFTAIALAGYRHRDIG